MIEPFDISSPERKKIDAMINPITPNIMTLEDEDDNEEEENHQNKMNEEQVGSNDDNIEHVSNQMEISPSKLIKQEVNGDNNDNKEEGEEEQDQAIASNGAGAASASPLSVSSNESNASYSDESINSSNNNNNNNKMVLETPASINNLSSTLSSSMTTTATSTTTSSVASNGIVPKKPGNLVANQTSFLPGAKPKTVVPALQQAAKLKVYIYVYYILIVHIL